MLPPPRIASFYYPTTTLLLSQDEALIRDITFHLDKRLAYDIFSSTQSAMAYIKRHHALSHTLTHRCFKPDLENEHYGLNPRLYHLTLDVHSLYETLYEPSRYQEPTVLVLDYAGLKQDKMGFLHRLKKHHLKKLLLINKEEQEIALRLFNQGLIDHYFLKEEVDSCQTLSKVITSLQYAFFEEATKLLMQCLQTQVDSSWKEALFYKCFHEICQQKNIIEYYLIDCQGSYLLLTEEGKCFWFIIKTALELNEITEQFEEVLPKPLLERLKKGEVLLYSNNVLSIQKKVANDELITHPARKLEGEQVKLYYALLENKEILPLDKDKYLPYKTYLTAFWPALG